jgi:hypothetical protein
VTLAGERRGLVSGTDPSWSADGAEIAFNPTRKPGEVWAIRGDGTGLRRIGSGSKPVWSTDGHLLAVRGIAGSVEVMRPDGTGHRGVADRAYHFPVVWDADGRRLGFLVGDGDEVRVVGVENGRAFGVLASRGIPELTTEIDETNAPSRGLLEGLGARRVGASVELLLRRTTP